MKRTNRITLILILLVTVITTTGCAPLLFAGGAAAGVAVAKDAEDGQIIDN